MRHEVRALDMVIRACKTSKSIGRRNVPYSVSTIDIITNLIVQMDASVINFEYRILNLYIVR
jgi:hypothetical protein